MFLPWADQSQWTLAQQNYGSFTKHLLRKYILWLDTLPDMTTLQQHTQSWPGISGCGVDVEQRLLAALFKKKKSWVRHQGKNKTMLKNTWNLGRKDKSHSDLSSVKLDSVLLSSLCQNNKTLVILRLFKRAGDREPVLPEALPKPRVEADADVRKLLGLSCLLRDWQSLWHHPCAQHGSAGVFHWLWWELAEVLHLSDVLMC